jgi:transcriptional regulator with XRE-family HTH domain
MRSIAQLGFAEVDLSAMLDVSRPTISKWRSGETVPTRPYYNRLDALRLVTLTLVEGEVPLENITTWFLSRASQPPHERPIDVIMWNPQGILDLAKFAIEQRVGEE